MTTITIQLNEACVGSLTAEANRLGLTVERVAESILEKQSAPDGVMNDDSFRLAMERTFQKNDELYHRLAR